MAPTNPSVFMLNNSVMLSWGQPPSVGINGELLGYSVHIQESNTVILVGQCYLSMELKKENISAESCVRVAAITKSGFGVPTSCVKIDLGEFTKPLLRYLGHKRCKDLTPFFKRWITLST